MEALSSFAAMVFRRAEYGLDVSSGCIISPQWLVPASVWIVFIGMEGQASLRSFSDKLHLRLPPTWRCELGRAWTFHRGALHLDPPVAFTFAIANDRHVICHVQSTCA